MDFKWRLKLTEPETGQKIKNLIRNRKIKGKRFVQKDICIACDLAPSSLSRFLSCKEEIPGETFLRLYQELKEYYKSQGLEKETEFIEEYIPPKALNKQVCSGKDLYFSYYVYIK